MGDTAYVCAMDSEGNAFSATPSDPALWGPLVPGLGIAISTRGVQFWLDPDHPSVLAPRKRPRLTPNPAMVLRAGRAFMPFGCPGGDAQTQGMLQVLSNIVDRGLGVQAAIEAPRAISYSMPNSFWPHAYEPGRLCVESRVADAVRAALVERQHRVQTWPEWFSGASSVCAIVAHPNGTFSAGADPRVDAYATGW
jgi:gamma-glutamyltranspeptidase/glutathione hydrolase